MSQICESKYTTLHSQVVVAMPIKAPPRAWVLYQAQMSSLWPRVPSPDASALPIPLKLLPTPWSPTPCLRQERNFPSPNSSTEPPLTPEYLLPSSPTRLCLLSPPRAPGSSQQYPLPPAPKPPSSLVPPPLPPAPPQGSPSLLPIPPPPWRYRRAKRQDRKRWAVVNGAWTDCTPTPDLHAALAFWGANPAFLDAIELPRCIRQAEQVDHSAMKRCGEQSLFAEDMRFQKEIFEV